MALFRKKRREDGGDVDHDRRSQVGVPSRAVLDRLIELGADLTQPRHVLYYSYAPNEPAGRAIAAEAEARGFQADVRDPLPDYPGQWSVVCEITAVTDPSFVRASDDFFEALATQHNAEYDGWEASV